MILDAIKKIFDVFFRIVGVGVLIGLAIGALFLLLLLMMLVV